MRLQEPLTDALASASHVRVLRTLFSAPLGLPASGREIARRAGLSHPTASKVLRDLEYQGLVRAQRQVGAEGFVVNSRNVLVQPLRALFEAEEAIPSRLTEWLKDALADYREVKAAYVFGSAARGEMTRSSDIDLAVVAPGAREQQLEERLQPVIDEFRRRVGAPVQLITTTSLPASLRAGRKRLWDRILAEGLVIKSAELQGRGRKRSYRG